MKKVLRLAAIAAAIASLAACNKTENEEPLVLNYENADFFVMNNGSWGMNNANVGLFESSTGKLNPSCFAEANKRGLGDTAQDILVDGSTVYIAVNTSQVVFVTDLNLNIQNEIVVYIAEDKKLSPRYITKANNMIYVTYYEGYLVEIDPIQSNVSRYVKVGSSPEGVAYANGKLFVANSGGANYPNYEKTLSVVDVASFTELRKVQINVNPKTVVACDNNVYVYSIGDYSSTPAKLQKVNASTYQVTDLECTSPSGIAMEGEKLYALCGEYDANWTLCGTVHEFNASNGSYVGQVGKQSFANAYSISACGGKIWIGTSDYKTNGTVYCLGADGQTITSFDSEGINPEKVACRK